MAGHRLTNTELGELVCVIIVMYSRLSFFVVFLYAVLLIRGPQIAFFKEPIPHLERYIDLYIRGPKLEERIYCE